MSILTFSDKQTIQILTSNTSGINKNKRLLAETTSVSLIANRWLLSDCSIKKRIIFMGFKWCFVWSLITGKSLKPKNKVWEKWLNYTDEQTRFCLRIISVQKAGPRGRVVSSHSRKVMPRPCEDSVYVELYVLINLKHAHNGLGAAQYTVNHHGVSWCNIHFPRSHKHRKITEGFQLIKFLQTPKA